MPQTPSNLEDVSKYPNLFAALLDLGWTENDLSKLASGNIMRVFKDVEKVKWKRFQFWISYKFDKIICYLFSQVFWISQKNGANRWFY